MSNIVVNDGAIEYGSRDLTFGSETYATDDFSYTIPTGTTIERTNSQSVPSGVVHIKGRTTGSCTIQLSDQSQALPEWGAQATIDEGVITITSVGRAETKGGETKVPITFALNITTSITITTD